MKSTYWKATLKYGHVGCGNEVTVSRYLKMSNNSTAIDVFDRASTMPGVKNRGVRSVKPISKATYFSGKKAEQENFYLIKLKSHRKIAA